MIHLKFMDSQWREKFSLSGNRWQKIKGFSLLGIGFLLSPLCWWNDLFLNLPIAYGFGYVCSLFSPQGLILGSIAGYWLSNILGILLMQFGATQVFKEATQETDLRKAFWSGVLSSTAFTLVVLLLVHWEILDMSSFNPGELLGIG